MTTTPTQTKSQPLAAQLVYKDLRAMARELESNEVRFLVDFYYQRQEDRKSANNQVRAAQKRGEATAFTEWLASLEAAIEGQIKNSLDQWTRTQPSCVWARSQVGIGPVIAAGLAAHIHIPKTPSVSALWRFAGLDPTTKWGKGQKRPWNARLQLLCWKIGESFVKQSGRPNCFYGHLYETAKVTYVERNEAHAYAERAAQILLDKKIGKDTIAYSRYVEGYLPDAHVHAMAKRRAVKIFLSHYWQVAYMLHHDASEAPSPWILTPQGGHVDRIEIPNWPMTDLTFDTSDS